MKRLIKINDVEAVESSIFCIIEQLEEKKKEVNCLKMEMEKLSKIFTYCKSKYGANVIGLRASNREFEPWDTIEKSHDYDIERECLSEKYLDGTSTVFYAQGIDHDLILDTPDDWIDLKTEDNQYLLKMRALEIQRIYRRKHVYLVCGFEVEKGDDCSPELTESVLRDCTVMMKII